MTEERSVRKMLALADPNAGGWSMRMLRERAECEETVEREQKAREALRRAEQRDVQQRAQAGWDRWYAEVLDPRIAALINQDKDVSAEATAQFVVLWTRKKTTALEARIAALEQQLAERQSRAKGKGDFKFARRNRDHAGEPSSPTRNVVTKVHYFHEWLV